VKIVHEWLAELAAVPADVENVAAEISLRGFEVASVERGVIDFEITANRPDCLNHMGIAREAAVIWGGSTQARHATFFDEAPAFPVAIDAQDLCPRYCAMVFDVKVGPSPDSLARRLEAAGVRPISNVVDITNYVMLEIGQPMHAFDIEHLRGGRIVVRRAKAGEKMRTLDGVERSLDPDICVIADAERAVAIGGVMGGQDSEINDKTTRIVLESAYFHPPSIRRTSKKLGLKTEASTRFERGGDVNAPPLGIARTLELMHELGCGTPAGSLLDVYPAPRQPLVLQLRADRIGRLLGQQVPAEDVARILQPLGFTVVPDGARRWRVTVPSFRVDVLREVDLIEEVGRHYGFDRLPITFPQLSAPQPPADPRIARDRLAPQVLAASGFSEAMTFAFIERETALPFCEDGAEPPAIANPLSEKFAVLRPSLLPGLVDACSLNRRRGRKDVQLFETGSRFTPKGEGRAAAIVWCGAAAGPHWSGAIRNVDFFDVKGAVEQLCAAFGATEVRVEPAERLFLVRGRSGIAIAAGTTLGVLGQLDAKIADARGLPANEEVFVAEIDMDALASVARGDDLRAQPLPRFPTIVRDVSILVDEALPAAAVRGTIRSAAPPTLESIVEFDRYQGKGVPDGRVSLSLRLTYRALDRTLTDDEAERATDRIVAALKEAHGAERR
jgi:phenylalanyl-tRNA synthetase beta chain